MNWHYLYLCIDLSCIIIPLLASFHPKIRFDKEWKYLFPAIIIVAIFFLIWDEWFTQIGVWGFNPDYLTGVTIGHLPLEEILFFICIPYACLFTFFCVYTLWPQHPLRTKGKYLWLILLIFSLLLAISQYHRLYTAITFGLLALVLLFMRKNISRFHFSTIVFSYLLITPFFLLSNGLLTGSGIIDQVVWYNNAENLTVRIGTIPFEDFYYGFLLILMNALLYQWFKKRKSAHVAQ